MAGLVSTMVHLSLFIVLALWFMPRHAPPPAVSLVSSEPWRRPDELVTEELGRSLEPAKFDSAVLSGAALDQLDQADAPVAIESPADTALAATAPALELAYAAPKRELLDVMASSRGDNVRAAVDSSAEAIDRITQELAQLMANRNLLVAWCFDQSGSMQPEREEIRQRIGKIYEELGLVSAGNREGLLTSVTSFGSGFAVHTERPTSDPAAIQEAIARVPVDDSGVEMMCQAVVGAMRSQRRWLDEGAGTGPRQLVVILVTDESGQRSDNLAFLERVIDDARRLDARVYVVGHEAAFGSPYEQVIWTDPETGVRLPVYVDRGPETAFLEVLQFTGSGRPTAFLASGFGPYDQVRLARETGGLFFLLPSRALNERLKQLRDAYLAQLRHYLPELDSRGEYTRGRNASPMRRAVWDVVSEFDVWDDAKIKHFTFPASLPVDAKAFVSQAGTVLSNADRLLPIFERAVNALQRAADSRREEPSRRWQANYDLLLAQVFAYRARINELVACLEPFRRDAPEVKNVYGEERPTNLWRLRPRADLHAAEKTKADVEQAAKLYAAVLANHPDTPWAWRAAAERGRPYAVELVEIHIPKRDPPPKVEKPNL